MWQVSHISEKMQKTEEKPITLFIEQMHRDTMTFKIKQHYIDSSSFDVCTHNAAAKILLALQLTEEFLNLLARSPVSVNYFLIPKIDCITKCVYQGVNAKWFLTSLLFKSTWNAFTFTS